ncbi:S41 family peptidase [Paramaledivibacter caminithermalis]|jgi:C-terminal processing protease CtpA/Prc|uniref:C-terminal processing protease CtpA/Prc, contains a PDZ domain n=1 Tax=Paramaledivibacter caminithermalis (strain DSM 15212 / CIP 107654 / DViRD3) TaxID=1121301 RepID=A0A1M6U123_PARC5|nr:S41 family peptidase [Paramaledivibacter caminithermalis]SHK62861.1 C-terminal processing protease CtpA/Prc, contains a PDZ domain [Paramaledivibacter caminithermalis DSM 15212]
MNKKRLFIMLLFFMLLLIIGCSNKNITTIEENKNIKNEIKYGLAENGNKIEEDIIKTIKYEFKLSDGLIRKGYYKGDLKDNLPNGDGIFKDIDGTKYIGHWKDGLPHGEGTYYNEGYWILDGKWENGEFVKLKDEYISLENAKDDLEQLQSFVVCNHPKLQNEEFREKFLKQIEKAKKSIKEPIKKDEFYLIVQELLATLKDGHTSAYFKPETKKIPLNILWLDEGIIITESFNKFLKGDKILKIGDKDTKQILSGLIKVIPAENEFWVRAMGESLLLTKAYLKKLGLIRDNEEVNFTVERTNGEVETIREHFYTYTFYERYKRNSIGSYSFKIYDENNLAIFALNRCIVNNDLSKEIERFFKQVKEKNISRIGVDLRENFGGNSSVINEFLRYIKSNKEYKPYVIEKNNRKMKLVKANNNNEYIYNGKIYILTSKNTFSSAMLFANTFKVNDIALIIGEPTGNSINNYGHTVHKMLENSNITVFASTRYWKSPDKNNGNTLQPDILIIKKRKDIIEDNDPVIKWLIESN